MDNTIPPDTDSIRAFLSSINPEQVAPALDMIRARVGDEQFTEAFFAVRSGQVENTERRPKFRRVGQFLTDVGEPPPMLIDRLLPVNSIVLLTGKPKQGKSYAALDMFESMVDNRPVWGEFLANQQGPVTYLAMEDGEYEPANRLLKRGIRKADDRLMYICTERIVLSTPAGIALYEEVIAEVTADAGAKPILHIIDTAREGLGIRDWNDPAEVSDKIRPVREFARRNGTVLLVAHNKKGLSTDAGDEISGSNAFASSVDGWISVQRTEKRPNGNRRMWLSIVGRGNMNTDCVIEMDTNDLRFRYLSEQALAEESREARKDSVSVQAQRIIAFIQNRPDKKATVNQIAEALGDTAENVRHDVKDCLTAGYIADSGERGVGGGRGPRPAFYVIANQGEQE